MKFECLIEILKEKKYIEYKDIYAKGIIVGHRINTEYYSVQKKILESIPEEYTTLHLNGIHLTTTKVLEDFIDILYEDDDEDMKLMNSKYDIFIRDERIELPPKLIRKALSKSERFQFKKRTEIGNIFTNTEMLNKDIKIKKQKEKKVEEFINSLP